MNPTSIVEAMMPQGWPTFALLSARTAGLVFVAPIWSMRMIPVSVRGAFAILLTIVLMPHVPRVELPPEALALPTLVAGEIIIGVSIGLVAAFLFHAVSLAGQVVSIQTGLSIAGTLNPAMGNMVQGLGELKAFFAFAIYLVVGGHLYLLSGLFESLEVIPPGTAFDMVAGGQVLLEMASTVFVTALRVAAPVIAAVLMVQIAMAILGKAVPQINVLMLAFPVTISVGLITLGAAIPLLGANITGWVALLPEQIDGLVGTMRLE